MRLMTSPASYKAARTIAALSSTRSNGFTSSTNPEAGTVTYTYDADSNVLTKKDARTITITYGYDVLNRVTGRTYSNGDPAVTYTYDQSGCLGLSACYNIGRRTSMTDADGSETWAYDQMGREWAERRVTNGITKSTAYTYNRYSHLSQRACDQLHFRRRRPACFSR
jgi:YD repeat-containing protein